MAEVLVVGAGPVGLTLACELRRRGIEVRIIDKNRTPAQQSKALALWSRTLEIFDDMGVLEPVQARANPIDGLKLFLGPEKSAKLQFTDVPSPYPHPLLLPQPDTEQILSDRLRELGTEVERGVECVDLRQEAESVSVRFRFHPATETEDDEVVEKNISFPWVVACDGGHSTLRRLLGLNFAGAANEDLWYLADALVSADVSDNEVSVFFHVDGVVAMFPLSNSRFRVILNVEEKQTEDDAEAASEPVVNETKGHDHRLQPGPTLDQINQIVQTRLDIPINIHEATWLGAFHIQERQVEQYRVGRVFLAGDAAHVHSPAGGQGMNTGIQDAYNLGWKLALSIRGTGIAHILLESYGTERAPVAAGVLRQSGIMTNVATARNPIVRKLRNTVLPHLLPLKFVQKRASLRLSELDICYKDSLLNIVTEDASKSKVSAGERLPLLSLETKTGERCTTYDVIRNAPHVLFLYGKAERYTEVQDAAERAFRGQVVARIIESDASAAAEHPDDVLFDSDRNFAETFGLSAPFVVAVRPDGYICYIGRGYSRARLLAHLGSFLQFQEEV
jgi:2-polyprenyl-6-methoxyphenol hydroxylase-like FAD-dependent oxidoreductase